MKRILLGTCLFTYSFFAWGMEGEKRPLAVQPAEVAGTRVVTFAELPPAHRATSPSLPLAPKPEKSLMDELDEEVSVFPLANEIAEIAEGFIRLCTLALIYINPWPSNPPE